MASVLNELLHLDFTHDTHERHGILTLKPIHSLIYSAMFQTIWIINSFECELNSISFLIFFLLLIFIVCFFSVPFKHTH